MISTFKKLEQKVFFIHLFDARQDNLWIKKEIANTPRYVNAKIIANFRPCDTKPISW